MQKNIAVVKRERYRKAPNGNSGVSITASLYKQASLHPATEPGETRQPCKVICNPIAMLYTQVYFAVASG